MVRVLKKQTEFNLIYETYKRYVYYIVLKRLKDFNDTKLSEEAVQEIFIKIFCNMDKFEEVESYKTKGYINRIIKTVTSDICKRENKKKSVIQTEEAELYLTADDVSLEKIIMKREISRLLKEKLEELNETDKELLKLRYIEEKSEIEISEIMNLSYDNVRTRMKRARRKMAAKLESEKEGIFDEF